MGYKGKDLKRKEYKGYEFYFTRLNDGTNKPFVRGGVVLSKSVIEISGKTKQKVFSELKDRFDNPKKYYRKNILELYS